jgi:hypothetical protein
MDPTRQATEDPADLAEPLWLRLALLCCRLTSIALIAWIGMNVHLPVLDDWLPLKNVLVAVCAIILAGKCLFDTFFYDHFRP